MDIKKMILTGSCAAALSLMGACGDDSKSPSEASPESPAEVGTPNSSAEDGSSAASSAGTNSSAEAVASSSSIANDAPPQMACSEIMYNAPDNSALEWVEIYIAGGSDMDDMMGYELHLGGAVSYVFPAEPLAKGEFIVVANDLNLFKATYPEFKGRLFGPWVGGVESKLPNEGDVVDIKLRGDGDVSCAFSNEPPWASLANGKGSSLVYKRSGNAAQATSWGASKITGGNPGVGDDEWLEPASVRINEIQPSAPVAKIELYNASAKDVDLKGWTIEVVSRKQTVTITSGVVPANGFVELDGEINFDTELVVSPQGGEFYLRGLQDGEESSIWVPATNGVSGVVDLPDGSIAQGPLAKPTFGSANSELLLGSVYINEIYYHPGERSVPFEFVEIVNRSDADIQLYSASAKKGWKVEGIGMEFAPTDILKAKAMMLLIPDSLRAEVEDIRSAYGISSEVEIRFFNGKLSNRGETIAIKEPLFAVTDAANSTTKYFYAWHDATLYSDNWEGLDEADGLGYSLQREDLSTMGFAASAWKAAEPTIGK